MSLGRKLLAATGAGALTLLVLGAAPASAAAPPSGGFADAKGVIVNLTVLTAIPVPGAFGNTPLDPNTFSNASQSCPPVGKDQPGELLAVPASPAVNADTVQTAASAKCTSTDAGAVAMAETLGVQALFNGTVPTITADVIRAVANTDCTKAPNATGSVFQNVKIAGTTILPDPAPNTVIPLPGLGSVIINEQHPAANGRGLVVNGLHIIGSSPLLRGDLVISHAESGVVCPNGKLKDNGPLPPPEITFDKDATPSTAHAGDTVTYHATVTNTSANDCDVISFYDHLNPVFDIVSTTGALGKTFDTPAPKRTDGGTDVILRPTTVVIGAKKSVQQTFVVKLKSDVAPGTYYNNLEIFCAVNGNFVSGPLAPVTVPAPVIAPPPAAVAPAALPRTGGAPLLAAAGVLLLLGAAGVRRAMTR